jgi:hypothetical protein
MSLSIGGVIFLIITIGCAVKATQNWRAFRAGKNRPLLIDVTAAELAAIPTEWPLRRDRWPPPWSDGKPAMEMQFARAYSLLAERIRRNLLLAAEVLLIVGGSWLGVTLDDIGSTTGKLSGSDKAARGGHERVCRWTPIIRGGRELAACWCYRCGRDVPVARAPVRNGTAGVSRGSHTACDTRERGGR